MMTGPGVGQGCRMYGGKKDSCRVLALGRGKDNADVILSQIDISASPLQASSFSNVGRIHSDDWQHNVKNSETLVG